VKDAIGQEITVGDKVCVCGGRYADARIQEVIKITAKRIQVPNDKWQQAGSFLDPDTVIVVTDNLRCVAGDFCVVQQDYHNSLVEDSVLLGCLQGAGIDNCEAYSIGYRDYLDTIGDEGEE